MLGVDFMISGAIGKLGNAFTIDAKMFSVSTGAAESMKSITYNGALEGLIVEIEVLAWEILDLEPPRSLKKKRNIDYSQQITKGNKKKLNWVVIGGALLLAGGGTAVALSGGDASSTIGEPPSLPTVP